MMGLWAVAEMMVAGAAFASAPSAHASPVRNGGAACGVAKSRVAHSFVAHCQEFPFARPSGQPTARVATTFYADHGPVATERLAQVREHVRRAHPAVRNEHGRSTAFDIIEQLELASPGIVARGL